MISFVPIFSVAIIENGSTSLNVSHRFNSRRTHDIALKFDRALRASRRVTVSSSHSHSYNNQKLFENLENLQATRRKKQNVESFTLQSEKSGLKRIAGGLEVDPRGCIPADRRTTRWFWFSVCWSLLVGSHAWPSDEIISSPRTWPCLIYIPRRFYCSRSAGWDTRSGLGPRKRGEARNAGNWISSLSRAQQYPWRYCCRAGFAPLCIRCEWHA